MNMNEEMNIGYMNERIERTKVQSVESSRQTVRKLMEAEEMAEKNIDSLAGQSNQISAIEVGIKKVQLNADKAVNRTDELKQLNKNFMTSALNPGKLVTNWKRKRALKKEEKHIEQVKQFEVTKQSEINSKRADIPKALRQDSKFTREHMAPDEQDIYEEEINRNMSYMSDSVKRIKEMTLSMNTELNEQNGRLNKTGKEAMEMGSRVRHVETKLKKIK